MAGIREQRDRVGRKPVNDLRHDQGEIERGRYRKGSTEIRHAVGVIVVIMVIVSARHAPLMRQKGRVIQSQPVSRAKSSRRTRRCAKKAVRIRIVQSEKPLGEVSGSITSPADPERRRNFRPCSVSRCLRRSSPDFWCSSASLSRPLIACIFPTPCYWQFLER